MKVFLASNLTDSKHYPGKETYVASLDGSAGVEKRVGAGVPDGDAQDNVRVFCQQLKDVSQRQECDVNVVILNFANGVAGDDQEAGQAVDEVVVGQHHSLRISS